MQLSVVQARFENANFLSRIMELPILVVPLTRMILQKDGAQPLWTRVEIMLLVKISMVIAVIHAQSIVEQISITTMVPVMIYK